MLAVRCRGHLRNGLYTSTSEAKLVCPVPSRKLDDRIRELCAQLVAADGDCLEPLIMELKATLREHNNRLRKMAAAKLVNVFPPRPSL